MAFNYRNIIIIFVAVILLVRLELLEILDFIIDIKQSINCIINPIAFLYLLLVKSLAKVLFRQNIFPFKSNEQ